MFGGGLGPVADLGIEFRGANFRSGREFEGG